MIATLNPLKDSLKDLTHEARQAAHDRGGKLIGYRLDRLVTGNVLVVTYRGPDGRKHQATVTL